jgi:predicted acetyltransferase
MNEAQLAERMRGWLDGEYEASLFKCEGETVGYALYREDPDAIYLRQLFICRDCRRKGLGRFAFRILSQQWKSKRAIVRLDVLSGNDVAKEFWRALGFRDYCVTMEFTL